MKAGGNAPFFVVFAGVNGAGKSTLYQSGLWRSADMPRRMERINPDEIVREMGGDWHSARDQFAAGKEALARIDSCIERGVSVCWETTLSGRLALRTIERARAAGFRVHLLYVGVESAELALKRIENRVSFGGHDIDEIAVRRRFRTSIRQFSRALDWCEQATAFDNTHAFVTVAQWSRGMLCWLGNPQMNAPWLVSAMQDETLWRV